MRHVPLILLIVLSVAAGCKKLSNRADRQQMDCGDDLPSGRDTFIVLDSDGQRLGRDDFEVLALEANGTSQRYESVTSKGCVVKPNRGELLVRAVAGEYAALKSDVELRQVASIDLQNYREDSLEFNCQSEQPLVVTRGFSLRDILIDHVSDPLKRVYTLHYAIDGQHAVPLSLIDQNPSWQPFSQQRQDGRYALRLDVESLLRTGRNTERTCLFQLDSAPPQVELSVNGVAPLRLIAVHDTSDIIAVQEGEIFSFQSLDRDVQFIEYCVTRLNDDFLLNSFDELYQKGAVTWKKAVSDSTCAPADQKMTAPSVPITLSMPNQGFWVVRYRGHDILGNVDASYQVRTILFYQNKSIDLIRALATTTVPPSQLPGLMSRSAVVNALKVESLRLALPTRFERDEVLESTQTALFEADNQPGIALDLPNDPDAGSYALVMSPDGKSFATAGSEGTIKIWSLATAQAQLDWVAHTGTIYTLIISPDNKLLASAGTDRTVKLWNLQTGGLVKTLVGHTNVVHALAFSPDSKTLVSGGNDPFSLVWDVESGASIKSLAHTRGIKALAINPRGDLIASGTSDNLIQIWDLASGAEVRSLSGHSDIVEGVVFSADGTHLVSGSYDKTVKLWDVANGKLIKTFAGHGNRVLTVDISKDGDIVSGASDGTIRIWRPKTSELIRTLQVRTREKVFGVMAVAFTLDASRIVSIAFDNTINIWDIKKGDQVETLTAHKGNISSVLMSHDGQRLYSASSETTIKVWDGSSRSVVQTLTGHKSLVTTLAISTDDRTLISGSTDATVRLWDLQSGAERAVLLGHAKEVCAIILSPDGRTIVSGSADGIIKIWDFATRKEVQSFQAHKGIITSLAISPDGRTLISAATDSPMKSWNLATGEAIKTFAGDDRVHSALFSPDGRHVITGSDDSSVKIWNFELGLIEKRLLGHDSFVRSLAVSPDGSWIVSGTWTGQIKLWSVANGREVKTLEGHDLTVNDLIFSPDGSMVVSASLEGNVKLYHLFVKNSDLVHKLCTVVGPYLNADEKEAIGHLCETNR